jgi:methylmalonyl-CoA mutase N-terminal domain/subunit
LTGEPRSGPPAPAPVIFLLPGGRPRGYFGPTKGECALDLHREECQGKTVTPLKGTAMAHDPQRLAAELQAWEWELLLPLLRDNPERRERFETSSGRVVERLYTPLDGEGRSYETALGLPGRPPFTRGVQPNMYRGRTWTMRQYAGFGSCHETNTRFRYLLSQGQTGLSVAFDLPTQMGYDSDDPLAAGEVGRTGVAIDTLRDMQNLLDAIPLDQVSVSMTINAPAAILLLMVVATAEQTGVEPNRLTGTIQNDILKEYIARGTYIFPPRPSMRLITDTFAWCQRELPRWNTISISGYHIREAGATAVQELAFTFADAIAYCEAARNAGLDFDRFAGRLSFFFNSHNHFLEEIAKFRAARRIWSRICLERFQARDPVSARLRFHTQTAGSTLTAQEPENNIVRVALQALAAVLGGTQSLHTNSFDEALSLPSERAARIALRSQQIIAEETGVCDTVDPLGGSYALETLTDQIEADVWEELQKIDAMGGMVMAIEDRYPQRRIEESAYAAQRALEDGRQTVIGLNKYVQHEETGSERTPPFQLRGDVEAEQKRDLVKVRTSRDGRAVGQALADLAAAAQTDANLMPPLLAAVRRYASVGEICNVLRRQFGEYRESL